MCVQKRFKFPEGTVELYAEKVANRGLCAVAQAESLRYKLLGGLAVRRCAPGRASRIAQRVAPPRSRGSRATALSRCSHALSPTPARATACCASSWSLAPRAAR
jgi:hypothetical protein